MIEKPTADSAFIQIRIRRSWVSLGVSLMIHALIVALATGLWRRDRQTPEEAARHPAAPGEQVDMVYLPPLPKSTRPARRPPPAAPTPAPTETRDTRPPSQRHASDEALVATVRNLLARQAAAEAAAPPPPPAKAPEPKVERRLQDPNGAGAPVSSSLAATSAAGTIESEAQRIFGSGRPKGTGPLASQGFASVSGGGGAEGDESNCRPTERAPTESTAKIEYGTAVGRVLRDRDGGPIGGAHLQMIGTPYVAFTDAQGWYIFRFDLALVRDCRSQLVWITAPGFERRTAVLVVGRNVHSDDLRLRP